MRTKAKKTLPTLGKQVQESTARFSGSSALWAARLRSEWLGGGVCGRGK